MKILVMTLTHNNVDVLPFWMRHYETFADKIVVWDDASTDGTRELLEKHRLVSARDWPKEPGINEDVFLKHWYEEYPKAVGEFDWVMIPDSDEFLLSPERDHSLTELLWVAKLIGYEVITSAGFNLVGDKFPKDDGVHHLYDINPMGVRAPIYDKPITFQPTAMIRWMRGRHQLENCNPRICPVPLRLLHARYFGADYTRKRNAKNYDRAGLLNGDKGPAWSCAPGYDGADKEGSPQWSEYAKTVAFNVLEARI